MPLGKRIGQSSQSTLNKPAEAYKLQDEDMLFQAEEPKYSFDDIILNCRTYDSIQDVLTIYEKKELLFDKWGLGAAYKQQNRAGINLYGYPGTGAKAWQHMLYASS